MRNAIDVFRKCNRHGNIFMFSACIFFYVSLAAEKELQKAIQGAIAQYILKVNFIQVYFMKYHNIHF